MNSLSEPAQFVFSAAVCSVLFLCVLFWLHAFRTVAAGRCLVDYEERRMPAWGLLDVLLTIFLVVLFQVLGGWLLESALAIEIGMRLEDLSSGQRAAVILMGSLATLASAIGSACLIWLRVSPSLADFGWQPNRLKQDIRLGVIAFVMFAPIVFAIQLLLSLWFKSRHPLIELLQGEDGLQFLALSGLSALIVAPIVEEYFFRVILQGWLERVSSGTAAFEMLFGTSDEAGSLTESNQPLGESSDAGARTGMSRAEGVQTPYAAYEPPTDEPQTSEPPVKPLPGKPLARHWPIAISSVLFALAHFSHGPDPIPLFVFAFAIGYLYHRTHRILPCIIIHLLLNATSLGTLWIAIVLGLDSPP